jgi:arylsulfatase A-like enzyme
MRSAATWPMPLCLGLAFLSRSALADPPAVGVASAPTRPNIVFILADDLGYGALGCYGQEKVATPRIDRMATEGMRFTQAYAGCSMCAPSRAVLMLGLHTGRTPVRSNGDKGLRGGDRDRTIAEVLHDAGYTTGVFGKWGLGDVDAPGAPWRQGFDRFFGFLNQTHAHFYYTDYLLDNDRRRELEANRDGKRGRYAHDLIVDEALSFIRANRDRPFFAYLPVTIPHAEILVPDDSLAKYRGRWPETPFDDGHYAAQPTPRAAYAGMVDRLDGDVGRILDLLKELGLDDRTIVFFSSDNGPITAGGSDPAFFRNAGPLRGLKFTFYEGGIRVPLIVRWPGHVPAGAVSDRLWGFQDFFPTAEALAGLPEDPGLDGVSTLPTLLGRSQPDRGPLYWETPGGAKRPGLEQAGRIGRYKGIIPQPGAPLEVYDLQDDVAEQRDLTAQRPDLARSFRELFEREHSPVGP